MESAIGRGARREALTSVRYGFDRLIRSRTGRLPQGICLRRAQHREPWERLRRVRPDGQVDARTSR